jgi:hypothetical protein
MKLCPECKRTFSNDLSFCLEDGTRLVDERSGDATLVYPDSTTIPSPNPTPGPIPVPSPAPAPAPSSNKSLVAVILGVLGTLLIVIIWGGIKIGIWYLDHNQNTNQNSGSNSPVASASPSPSYNPLSLITGSPSPTPSPIESPSPSLSPSPDDSKKGIVTAGTYEWEGTRTIDEDKQLKGTLRMRVAISNNGTYLQQVFITIPEKSMDNLLGMEEKGRFTQSGDSLMLSGRKSREINFATGEWQPWGIPSDGSSSRENIRNVDENSFQLYDSSEKDWFTFVKVINLGNLDR